MKTFGLIVGVASGLFWLTGCATGFDIPGTVAEKIAAPLTKAVFGLAVDDAKTTLAWIDVQLKAGALSADDAKLAKACPQAVLEAAALRDKLLNPPGVEGFKGLIYNATVTRWDPASKGAAARTAALQVLAACSELAPDKFLF